LIGSSQSVPEYLTNGTTLSPYYFAIPVAQTVLAITDRIAIRIYVNVDGRTVTLHTENNHLCQVVTTFSKGLTSLNNLTRQVQFLATGTSGTDFGISSSVATHTFNLPIASATNTGKLSSTDWSTFNGKQPAGNYVTLDTTQTITAAKTFTGVVSSIADTNAAAYILQGRTSDDLAQIQFKNNAGTNTKAKISVYSVGTNGGGMQFLVKPDGLPEVSSLSLSSNQADFETSVTSTGIFRGTTLGILNSTFTSTIGASLTANRTITLPDLSGTLALLEGTQTFTGNKRFDTGVLIKNGVSPSASGYTGIGAGTSGITVNLGSGGGGYLIFQSTSHDYTFPAATGTLALTSNLSAYLPLAGGTLTGPLSGTSATFSSNISTTNATIFAKASGTEPLNYQFNSITIGYDSANTIGWITAGGAASRTNLVLQQGGGNVGIGTSSPSGLLSLKAEVTNTPTIVFQNVSGGPNSAISNFTSAAQTLTILGTNMYIDAASNIVRFNTSYQGSGIMFDEGIIRLYTGTSGMTPTSRVSISSGGEVSINNTSTTARFNLFESAAKWAQIINHTRAAGQFFIQFQYNGSEIGAISGNASNTTYATSSDYRLKEDLKDFNGIELVSKINVYDFAWKSDNTRRMYGVVAHEMAEVLPYAVNKEKDLVKENGKIDAQGVDYSLITPLLVKAIQELEARIKQLENK
jgi:hypothetical protein